MEIYTPDSAIKEKIFTLRSSERPYLFKEKKDKWHHQKEAMHIFWRKSMVYYKWLQEQEKQKHLLI